MNSDFDKPNDLVYINSDFEKANNLVYMNSNFIKLTIWCTWIQIFDKVNDIFKIRWRAKNRVNKVDVSSTFYWRYISVYVKYLVSFWDTFCHEDSKQLYYSTWIIIC